MNTKKPVFFISLLFFFILTLTGCGGGGGGGGGSTDVTPPEISSTNPIDGATGVDSAISPNVMFDEDMLSTSVTSTEFALMQGSANVPATVSFDGSSNTATLDPTVSLALLSAYTASLSAGITDLSGNTLAASSWRFTTRDGQWQTPSLLEINNAGNATIPQIAIDSSGNALAVWRQSDGSRENIWANRFTPSAGWAAAELIETNNAGSANTPQIAIDSSGNALAVWRQSDGARSNIWVNRFE